ncbi:MAG: Ig-like domain-containing protein [Candidatus Sulfotelmatobacter sp.]
MGTPAVTTTVTDPLMEGETGVYEWGKLNTIIDEHYGGETASSGSAASNGAQVQCSANAAIAVMSCAARITCGTSVTISVGASGMNASVSFPPGNIFAANTSYPITCIAKTLPGLTSIAVTPADWTIWNVAGGDGAPTTQQYTATGTYSNGTTSTLTNAVWTSSNTSIATISSTGLAKATGTAWGTLTITSSSGGISGSTQLTVSYNTDQGGGGGGDQCGGDFDCPDNECCYNGSAAHARSKASGKT